MIVDQSLLSNQLKALARGAIFTPKVIWIDVLLVHKATKIVELNVIYYVVMRKRLVYKVRRID